MEKFITKLFNVLLCGAMLLALTILCFAVGNIFRIFTDAKFLQKNCYCIVEDKKTENSVVVVKQGFTFKQQRKLILRGINTDKQKSIEVWANQYDNVNVGDTISVDTLRIK